jgi:hypothetical protein
MGNLTLNNKEVLYILIKNQLKESEHALFDEWLKETKDIEPPTMDLVKSCVALFRADMESTMDSMYLAVEWNLDPLYNLITDEFDCDDFLF